MAIRYYVSPQNDCWPWFKQGKGLWNPSPGSIEPTRVGDVGFFDSTGTFVRLFNALLPANDPAQEYWPKFAMPAGYKPLELASPVFQHGFDWMLPLFHSQNVSTKWEDARIVPDDTTKESVLNFIDILTLSGKEGAILIVSSTEGALHEGALKRCRQDFKQYMRANYQSWFQFAVEQCDSDAPRSPEELVFVMESVTAREWALAMYNSHGGSTKSKKVEMHWNPMGSEGYEVKFTPAKGMVTSCSVPAYMRSKEDGTEKCVFMGGYRMEKGGFFKRTKVVDDIKLAPQRPPKRVSPCLLKPFFRCFSSKRTDWKALKCPSSSTVKLQ